jgi:hypothetical protein
MYGVSETNSLPDGYHKEVTGKLQRSVDWRTPGLRIIRLRLLSDPGYPRWDVSYCHGVMPNGEYVDVGLPFGDLPKRGMRRAIVEFAKKDGIYAKKLGILDNISTLI